MAEAPLQKTDPLIVAWEAYKASQEYANTRRWALHQEHVDGSLWASFVSGYKAPHAAQAEPRVPPGREDMNAISRRIVELADRADERRARLGLDEPQEPLPFTWAQRRRLWLNSPEIQGDVKSFAAFMRVVQFVERAHGISKKEGSA